MKKNLEPRKKAIALAEDAKSELNMCCNTLCQPRKVQQYVNYLEELVSRQEIVIDELRRAQYE